MKTKSNKLFIIVCLTAIFALILFCGCSEQNDESTPDISVNTEASENVSDTETSDQASESEVSIPEDHTHKYSEAWSSNETDHWHECECGDKADIVNHTFGDWTTTKEATETATGSKKRTCSVCSYEEASTIPMLSHTHDYAKEWSSNETDHWHECKCGDKSDIVSHTYGDWTVTKEATEETEGSKYHTCTSCGYKETAVVPALEHTHKYSDKWSTNETDHWKECKCGDKSNISNHNYGNWTVTKEATEEKEGSKYHACNTCGYKETVTIPVLSHTHSFGGWKNNDTSHWKECMCGEKSEFSSHTYGEWATTKEATCTATGTKKHICTACSYSETATVPVIAHTHGDWKSNATSHWKECKCGDKSQLSTHTYGAWEITKEASCTATGTKKHTCTVCGYRETATISVISHTYGDWNNNDTSHWKECKCGDKSQLSTHAYGEWTTVTEATCTTTGTKKHTCTLCSYSKTATINATGHIEVIDDYVAATCTTDGKTQGKHCSSCGTVLVAQEIVKATGHSSKNLTIKPKNCQLETVQVSYVCDSCSKLFVENISDITIAFKSVKYGNASTNGFHYYYADYSVAAKGGYGDYLYRFEVYNSLSAETADLIEDYSANNTISFQSESSMENAVIKVYIKDSYGNVSWARAKIGTLDKIDEGVEKGNHIYNSVVTSPTKTTSGYTTYTCTECNYSYIGDYVLPALGLEYQVNDDGATCTITNATLCTETELIIPNTYDGYRVTAIKEFAFSGCGSLKSIVIPDFITSIGNGAFKGCSSLEKITLPFIGESKDATGYRSMFGFIFGYTTRNGSKKITNATYQCVEGNYFYHYYIPKTLTSIVLSESITSIGEGVFYNCENIVDIKLGNKLTEIGERAFENCSSLKTITIPAGVKVISIQSFANCGLETVTFAEGSVCEVIDWNGFRGCKKLTSIELPSTVTNIEKYAFYECTSLTEFIIPEKVTNISTNAFALSGIETIYIPKNVKYIGYHAFADITNYSMYETTGWKRAGAYVGRMTLDLLKTGDLTHS